jgi:hypothetical protein
MMGKLGEMWESNEGFCGEEGEGEQRVLLKSAGEGPWPRQAASGQVIPTPDGRTARNTSHLARSVRVRRNN